MKTLASLVVWLTFAGLPAQAERPNILFIVVDDQSPYDLKAYDPDSALETPNIDRLVKEGITFDAAHHMGGLGRRRLHAIAAYDHVGAYRMAYSR